MILTAEVTNVQVGFYSLEGLMDEKGNYHVGIPQIADLVQTNRNTASRDFKRLMGEGFKTSNPDFNPHLLEHLDCVYFGKLSNPERLPIRYTPIPEIHHKYYMRISDYDCYRVKAIDIDLDKLQS